MDELAWDTGFWDGVEHARAEMARADFQNIGLVMIGYGRHVRECRKRSYDPKLREWRPDGRPWGDDRLADSQPCRIGYQQGWFAGRAEFIAAYIEQRRAQA